SSTTCAWRTTCCRTFASVRSRCRGSPTALTENLSGARTNRLTPPPGSTPGRTTARRPRRTSSSTRSRHWHGSPPRAGSIRTRAWFANGGVIDLPPWHSRIDEPNQPDWAVFALDPFEPATFRDVIDIAKLVKAALEHYGMHGVAKTSGQTGLQIYVPVRRGPDYSAVRHWVEEVGRAID